MILRWFFSATYRAAAAARKHHAQLLAARRDGLSPEAVAGVQTALAGLTAAMAEGYKGRMRIKIEELHFASAQWISTYPQPVWRSLVEVILVALVVALGIRTFFAEPFKIPTGSMQPTLFGVVYENLIDRPDMRFPTGMERVRDWFEGVSYVRVVAPADGAIEKIGPVVRFLALNVKQSFWIGGVEQVVWFPPEVGEGGLGIAPRLARAAFVTGEYFHKGDAVISLRREAGDYLLAERLTCNFRKPARGEIVVFKTRGIAPEARQHFGIPPDEFYIKRLVALPGERVQIGDDNHLIIDGRRLDAATPHFGNLYGFAPGQPPRSRPYLGHLNGWTARRYGLSPGFAPLFPNQLAVYTNDAKSCLVMGDNTVDSLDSRYWGGLAEDAIIGKCWFVFWPITKRFGWGNQ